MNNLYLSILMMFLLSVSGTSQIPSVFSKDQPDVIQSGLNHRAAMAYKAHQAPRNLLDWEERKKEIRGIVFEKTGAREYHDLPLEYRETKVQKLNGVTVKNIYFQTRPGVYATANLYIPEGEGPFPAVITMMGHSSNGRIYDLYQAIGQSLAQNGYVSLHMDPWGAGERSTVHGEFEYHGANLGASFFDIGESLMGMQITDNMRGVDLLSSLPNVDASRIGATGSSGGGNQTMWLSAMDERIKAAMPVVSVGTFQSYIMASNCVCETLLDGLTFAEESEILGLVAPRSLKLVNAGREQNKAFLPDEMKRSYRNAQSIFDLYDVSDHLANQVIDMTHGYHPEVREALLGWMDLHLKGKGNGEPRSVGNVDLLPAEKLMAFDPGKRPMEVMNTPRYCKENGARQKELILSSGNVNVKSKISELKKLLRISMDMDLKHVYSYVSEDGWKRYALDVSGEYMIPILIHESNQKPSEYVIIAQSKGKSSVSSDLIRMYEDKGKGVVLVDFWGIGESHSKEAERLDGRNLPAFHTLSRSMLWLGESMEGRWVGEMNIIGDWLKSQFNAKSIDIYAVKDLGPAALFYAALAGGVENVVLEESPISYLFDDGVTDNFYSMAIHVPGIMKWGDISLAAALSGSNVKFVSPRTISGRESDSKEIKQVKSEYDQYRNIINGRGTLTFDK